jgi:HK97 gp10 family phage protein
MGPEIRNDRTMAVIGADEKGAAAGILETVIMVTAQAKELSPVDTGEMRNEYFYEADGLDGVSANNSDHSVYQELGTRKMAAQPSLRPAVDIVVKGHSAEKAMADAMRDTVKRATL